jgi:(1->4)-alpha-D-glucan 1-alpha-D-glucosylmutase
LLKQTFEAIAGRGPAPESTYRLQFHAGFTFADARSIVPYLSDLGVTHCYASPYLKARPGSQHGYDITDHRVLNPEIGTEETYQAWVEELHARGMGQILDTVPNHMGIVGNENPWWNDVLENGPSSPYAGWFDIGWEDSPRPELHNRVLLPFLGEPYGKVLESQQIRLVYEEGAFSLWYGENRFPVAPYSYQMILEHDLPTLETATGIEAAALQEYKSILTAVSHLAGPDETDAGRIAEREGEKEVVKRRLAKLSAESPIVRDSLAGTVAAFNGKADEPHSFDMLEKLLDRQAYRLSYWRVASDEVNYRRFFDVNELAALSMEKPEVFRAAHELIFRLLAEGQVDGLRIDHPDGLYDPKQYLDRLQTGFVCACARKIFDANPAAWGGSWEEIEGELRERIAAAGGEGRLYVVVEKILGKAEALPADWACDGTSGYDFVNVVNGLFVDPAGEEPLTRLYREWAGGDGPFAEVVFSKKYLILRASLSSELQMLARQLDRLAQRNRRSRDFTLNTLRFVLRQVIASFPVYRSYISDEQISDDDRKYVESAVRRAIVRNPTLSPTLFRFVRDVVLQRLPDDAAEDERASSRRFAGKFQQVTSPVMAKGLEDTAFYTYTRLLSLNEVGGDPGRFGVGPEAVHRFNEERQAHWPYALSPLSTHDTKRGEDVRARLNVLSELTEEWRGCVERWGKLNEGHRTVVDDVPAPDRNEEYLIYQTLVGAWPLTEFGDDFVKRIQAYLAKALNEGKVHTSWINPNEEYEKAVHDFVARILDESWSGPFLEDFRRFQRKVSHFGLLNSLAQTLLRITAPGVPDTYQGTELWDFSLVDPDNRRPVDYGRRRDILAELLAQSGKDGDRRELCAELLRTREDGRIKLYVTAMALRCRRDHAGLFSAGEYLPGEGNGKRADHVFAFARRHGRASAVVAAPRLLTRLNEGADGVPLGDSVWGDTRLSFKGVDAGRYWNVLTGDAVELTAQGEGGAVAARDLFAVFPVALLLKDGADDRRG